MQELAPGLFRWTARHPDWVADAAEESPADWPEEVGSIALLAGQTLVLVDPLVPAEVWPDLDELARDRRVHVLTTIAWHRRSRDAVVERFDLPIELVLTSHGEPVLENARTALAAALR